VTCKKDVLAAFGPDEALFKEMADLKKRQDALKARKLDILNALGNAAGRQT
jgi:hypothetical protein